MRLLSSSSFEPSFVRILEMITSRLLPWESMLILPEVLIICSRDWVIPICLTKSESTSNASFLGETSVDSNTELSPTSSNGAWVVGGGLSFGLGSRLSGGINVGMVSGRNDYNETFASGGLSFRF